MAEEFKNILHRSFKKVRINPNKLKNEEVHNLMNAKSFIGMKITEILEYIKENPELIDDQSTILVSLQEKIDVIRVGGIRRPNHYLYVIPLK